MTNSTYRVIPSWVKIFANMALLLPILFLVACLLLNIIRTDYNPFRNPMSDYAVGSFGKVMALAFVSFGIAVLSLVVLIFHVGPRSILAKIALLFLTICGIGLFSAALFPTDLPGNPPTTSGMIHIIDAIINLVSISIGSFLLTFSFRKDSRWKSYFTFSLVLSMAIIFAFLFWFFSPGSIFGLTNKLFVISLCAWVICTASFGKRLVYKVS